MDKSLMLIVFDEIIEEITKLKKKIIVMNTLN